jgi:hypothetical protein
MQTSTAKPKLAPLEVFDARIVQTPIQGLLRNMDCDLVRLLNQSTESLDSEAERKFSLFLMMLRFTKNSYEAASFLCSDADDAPKRKREFVLILPPINRQLLDLLFTLVFMLDDFPARSLAYELSGYRQLREEYDKFHNRYGTDPKWQTRFEAIRELQQRMERYLPITPEQKADPILIPYWRAPYKLMLKATTSKPFMEFLERWLYGETSTQAHLNAAGLFSVAEFVVSDLVPDEDERKMISNRNLETFKLRHFSRLLIMVLAIASEMNYFCQLKDRESLCQLWVMLGGYVPEAVDMYKQRYQAMLS